MPDKRKAANSMHNAITKLERRKIANELLPKRVEKLAASVKLRHDFLQSQKRANYVNEYNRLEGALQKIPMLSADMARLENRQKDLKKLIKHIAADKIPD